MPRRERVVVLAEDGMPGGVRRATDYLVQSVEQSPYPSPLVRVTLRGERGLAASVPVYLGALAWVAALVVRRRTRLLHVNVTQRGSTARALPLVALARLARVPVVLHLHSSEYPRFVVGLPPPGRAAVRWMFRRADRVLVLGEGWATFVRRELGVPSERVRVLPNAVPGPALRPARLAREAPLRVLFLGQLGERKGTGDLLDALARPALATLPWEATLGGDGDAAPYRAQAERLGIAGRVRFAGWLAPAEVTRALEEAEVLVLPSRAEGLPLALLEGFAHGLAVVATPVGAVPEVVRDDTDGLLTPPGDVDALAAALARLAGDAALRARLGGAAREAWERRYSLEAYGQRVAAVYAEVAPA